MGKRYLVLLLAISIFLNVPMKINAAEIMEYNSDMQVLSKSIVSGNRTRSGEPFLFDCELAIGIAKNGLGVEFTTRCSTDATEIGIKDAVLQEKHYWVGKIYQLRIIVIMISAYMSEL